MELLDKNRAVVYMIVNTKNKSSYIGSTKNLSQRIRAHFGGLKAGKHYNKRFQEDFVGHTAFDYTIEVLYIKEYIGEYTIEIRDHVEEMEKILINQKRPSLNKGLPALKGVSDFEKDMKVGSTTNADSFLYEQYIPNEKKLKSA